MTETANFKLKKPGKNDPVDIDVLNENFDKIDEKLGGVSTYVIDITSVLNVDFWETGTGSIDLTDTVDGAAILAAADSGSLLRLRFLNEDDHAVEIALDDRMDTNTYTVFGGIANNPYYRSYSQFELRIRNTDDSATVELHYHPNAMGAVVTSINGVAPDENGNIDLETAEEKPVHMDISGYYDGLIVLDYKDDGKMNIDVTFDANGNPIKFSNGVEEFTITWPTEDTAETTEEAIG